MGQNKGNSDKKTFHLTETQRSKLKDESKLGKSPGTELRDIREKKVERLPERIDRLLADIAVLSDADFFAEDWNSGTWDRVQVEQETWNDWRWDSHAERLLDFQHHQPHEAFPESERSPRLFGTELGHSMRILFENQLSEDGRYDLLLGFLIGLLHEGPSERYAGDPPQPHSKEILEKLRPRLEAWEFTDRLQQQSTGKIQENANMRRNIILECLNSAGLTDSRELTEYLLEETSDPSLDIDQTDQRRTRFQREVENVISELIKNSDIEKIEELMRLIDDNMGLLRKKKDNYAELFQYVHLEDEATTDDFDLENRSEAMQQIRIMAGEYDYSGLWLDTPVLESTNRSFEKTSWHTTAFGELLGYIRTTGKHPGWLHQKVLPQGSLSADEHELIQNALVELDL